MISTMLIIAAVLFLFGITIFVHELGHFLVARWCGMVVDAFSIGIGPSLWKRKINGVTYKIGIFPFGGYVALPQMDPSGGNPHGKGEAESRVLPPIAPWKKLPVAVAGAIGNIILAYLLAWLVFLVGKPSAPHEVNTLIGFVDTNSAAYASGLRIGDEIKSVNGEAVQNWEDIMLAMALSTNVQMEVAARDGSARSVSLPTQRGVMGVWTVPGLEWMSYVSVVQVMRGSSAEKAGLRPEDLILEFAGEKLFSIPQFLKLVGENGGREVPMTLRRGREVVTVNVTPTYDAKENRALIGIMFNTMFVDKQNPVHPRPLTQLREHASSIFKFLKALVTPHQAAKASQAVGGPLSILFMFWFSLKSSIIIAIWFTAFVNVNLAILNLLPIPVLDGGHIMFTLWEIVSGKAVSAKVVNFVWNAFAALLLLLFLLLTYRDVLRWIVPNFGK